EGLLIPIPNLIQQTARSLTQAHTQPPQAGEFCPTSLTYSTADPRAREVFAGPCSSPSRDRTRTAGTRRLPWQVTKNATRCPQRTGGYSNTYRAAGFPDGNQTLSALK